MSDYVVIVNTDISPDPARIAALEAVARGSGELRVRAKNELSKRLVAAIERGSMPLSPEFRTYTTEAGD